MTDIEEVPDPVHVSIELTPEQVAEIAAETQPPPAAVPSDAPPAGPPATVGWVVPAEHITQLHAYIDKLEQATGKEWTTFITFVRTHVPKL